MAQTHKPRMKEYAGFNVLFSYIDQDGEPTPCMALGNPSKRSSFIIPLGSAFKYADSESGEPTSFLALASVKIAESIGLYPDKSTCFRIASAVVDNLPDLIEMPPKPRMTQADMKKKMEQAGLVVDLNGQRIVDAG